MIVQHRKFLESYGYRAQCLEVRLGQFLENDVKWHNKNGQLKSTRDVNKMSRYKLAEQFMNKHFAGYPPLKQNKSIKRDIAVWIDKNIPKYYYLKLNSQTTLTASELKLKYQGIHQVKGLRFALKQNYRTCNSRNKAYQLQKLSR